LITHQLSSFINRVSKSAILGRAHTRALRHKHTVRAAHWRRSCPLAPSLPRSAVAWPGNEPSAWLRCRVRRGCGGETSTDGFRRKLLRGLRKFRLRPVGLRAMAGNGWGPSWWSRRCSPYIHTDPPPWRGARARSWGERRGTSEATRSIEP
jgi:hypothetical protein